MPRKVSIVLLFISRVNVYARYLTERLKCRLPWLPSEGGLRDCDEKADVDLYIQLLTSLVYKSSLDMLRETGCVIACETLTYRVHVAHEAVKDDG